MPASLLPGFRDVRSALVAGYMWFCAGRLLIGHYAPPPGDLLGKPALELLDLFGTGGRPAAISVLCLLIGEVSGGVLRLSVAQVRRLDFANHVPRRHPAALAGAGRGGVRQPGRAGVARDARAGGDRAGRRLSVQPGAQSSSAMRTA
ncbi:hypothetical protein ACGFMK_02465 [Amycolatopsis sp. NPDC049252]|uniref:hypothetical protein n=1 Tax=Amycolatopsis sp. NPDC049252 TaxID=3363933 RepID=UPI00371A3CAA